MRGARTQIYLVEYLPRIIPADAGSTFRVPLVGTRVEDHPRGCGEHAAMAQFERDLIRERTNAGLKAARSRGRVGGRRHKLSKSDEAMVRQLYASKSVTVNEIAQRFRISRGTVYGVLWPRIRAHKEKRTGRTIKHVAVRPTHTFQHLQMTLVFIVFPSAFYCHKDNHRHPSHWISA